MYREKIYITWLSPTPAKLFYALSFFQNIQQYNFYLTQSLYGLPFSLNSDINFKNCIRFSEPPKALKKMAVNVFLLLT